MAQVVVCFVLLVSAGLFARSLGQLERADVGFDPGGVINLGLSATQLNLD